MNIAMLLDMAADGIPDRIAFGTSDDGLSYAQLRERALGIASRLDATATHTLAIACETTALVPAALFGAAWAGVSYAPLNYRLPDSARLDLLHRLRPVEVADDTWLDAPPRAGTEFHEAPERPAVLLFTSGTTAEPKAAVLEHGQLLAYQFNTVEFASAGEDEAVIVAVPPFHIAGVTAVLTSTYAGRRVVPLARFDAHAWLQCVNDERVTHAFLVPTMLARIVAALEDDPSLAPKTLRHLAYGGARLPAPVLERALRLFPTTGFVNAYGLTETSSTVAVLGPDDHRTAADSSDPSVRARLGSAGRPVTGIEIKVLADDGANCPVGVVGEIVVRGDQVSGAYVGKGSQQDDAGWLRTGDRGHLDDEGFVFVDGRGDDTIIRGGENLAAAEIEDALLEHPAVGAAAAVGIPDEEWGERVGAMVSPRSGASVDVDAVRAFVRERLGSLKTPDVIMVRDELPQTATGKILRRQVKADLVDGAD